MNCLTRMIKQKVYAYIITKMNGKFNLLVFDHFDFRDAGIQVTGGSVEPGEDAATAVVRETQEETDLIFYRWLKNLGW